MTLLPGSEKAIHHIMRKSNEAGYRVLDTVRTVRGEGVITFVFRRGRDGKAAYSVIFSNKRVGVIFHEHELAPCVNRYRHA